MFSNHYNTVFYYEKIEAKENYISSWEIKYSNTFTNFNIEYSDFY